MDRIEAVIFDFDGVVLDSANIKTEAFLQMFEEYPRHLEAIKDYHIQIRELPVTKNSNGFTRNS